MNIPARPMPNLSFATDNANLLALGGTPESQRDFLETFSADTSADPGLVNDKRKGKMPPIANQFALGYTYRDVLDADQEGAETLRDIISYLAKPNIDII